MKARTPCVLLKVYDGDTVGCDLNGDHWIDNPGEHIRLLGIDAPEMHYSKKNKTGVDQPFALEATNWISRYLRQTLYLEFDTRRIDRYGRLLAFIYTTPKAEVSLNEMLVSDGLAVTMFIPPNHKYDDRLQELSAQACHLHKGLWRLRDPGC